MDEPIPRALRWIVSWDGRQRGLALWVPWRHASRPLIYCFWFRVPSGWKRLFD